MSHEFVTAPPDPRLRRFVRNYTEYRESGEPVARLEEPPGQAILIFSFGHAIDVVDAAGRRQTRRSFAIGLHDRHSTTEHDGRQHGIEVRLDPFTARAVLGVPLAALANQVVEIDDLLGARAAQEVVERLAEARDWSARFRQLDRLFARALVEAPYPDRRVQWAWRRINATDGRVPVAELARELGWSRRHLAARFRAELGLPPKTVARLVRFDRVATRLRRADPAPLAQIAFECGYYDQAHLTRDFREFAGCTPGEFAARLMPDGIGVAAEFPSVQDGTPVRA